MVVNQSRVTNRSPAGNAIQSRVGGGVLISTPGGGVEVPRAGTSGGSRRRREEEQMQAEEAARIAAEQQRRMEEARRQQSLLEAEQLKKVREATAARQRLAGQIMSRAPTQTPAGFAIQSSQGGGTVISTPQGGQIVREPTIAVPVRSDVSRERDSRIPLESSIQPGEGLRFVSDIERQEFRVFPTLSNVPVVGRAFRPLGGLFPGFDVTQTGLIGVGTGRTILEEQQRRFIAAGGDPSLAPLNPVERRQETIRGAKQDIINQFESTLLEERDVLQGQVDTGILTPTQANLILEARSQTLGNIAGESFANVAQQRLSILGTAQESEAVGPIKLGESGREAAGRIALERGKTIGLTVASAGALALGRPEITVAISGLTAGAGSLKIQESILNENISLGQRGVLLGVGALETGLGLAGIRTAIGPQSIINPVTGQRIPSSQLEVQNIRESIRASERSTLAFRNLPPTPSQLGDIPTTRVTTLGQSTFDGGRTRVISIAEVGVTPSGSPRVILGRTKGEITVRSVFGEELRFPSSSTFETTPLSVQSSPATLFRGRSSVTLADEGSAVFGRVDINQAGRVSRELFFGTTSSEGLRGIPGQVTRVGLVTAQRSIYGSGPRKITTEFDIGESFAGQIIRDPSLNIIIPRQGLSIRGNTRAIGFEPSAFEGQITIRGATPTRSFRPIDEQVPFLFPKQDIITQPLPRLSPAREIPLRDIPTIAGGQGGTSQFTGLGLELPAVESFSFPRQALGTPGIFVGERGTMNIQANINQLISSQGSGSILRPLPFSIQFDNRKGDIRGVDTSLTTPSINERINQVIQPTQLIPRQGEVIRLGEAQLQSPLLESPLVTEPLTVPLTTSLRTPIRLPPLNIRGFGFDTPRVARLDTGVRVPLLSGRQPSRFTPSITGVFLGLQVRGTPKELAIGGFNPFQLRGIPTTPTKKKGRSRKRK